MESAIDKLRIQSLKGQIAATQLYSVALAKEFETAADSIEKTKFASQYGEALKHIQSMQLLLEMLELKQANPPREPNF